MDIYLALAGFFQVLVIGLLGTIASDIINPNTDNVRGSSPYVFLIILVIVVFGIYRKAFQLIKKNKKKKS